MIDVIIPVAAKDYPKLGRCLSATLRNSRTRIGTMYLIAADDGALAFLDAASASRVVIVRECEMPFRKRDIEAVLEEQGATAKQASWYYQQLLKFYVFEVIPKLAVHVLILDADFIFCKPISFLTDDGRAFLSRGYPFRWLINTRDYPARVDHVHADFARRFVAGWEPVEPFSGMHHHMVFARHILAELFAVVERQHRQPFWRAFAETVRLEKWNAASEFVLYYHYAMARHPGCVVVRNLKTCDIIHDSEAGDGALEALDRQLASGEFDAVGCHAFLGLEARIQTMDYIPHDLRSDLASVQDGMFRLLLDNAMLQVDLYARG